MVQFQILNQKMKVQTFIKMRTDCLMLMYSLEEKEAKQEADQNLWKDILTIKKGKEREKLSTFYVTVMFWKRRR